MPENKHASISADLEKSIRSGKYFERLPPVRILARDYGVSLQTMSKALKPLQNSGLICSGPGGTCIMENIPHTRNTGVVTVFMLNDSTPRLDLSRDPLLQTLREEAAKDDISLVVMLVNSQEIYRKTAFWESRHSDGYLFLYSSFYPMISRYLNVVGVPYVVGNWLPGNIHAHWVDFDGKKRLFDLVKLLLDRGYRKIAYMQKINFDFGIDFHCEMWQDICSSYGIHNYTPDAGFFAGDPLDNLERFARDLNGIPEVLIPSNCDAEKLSARLDEQNWQCKILLPSDVPLDDPRVIAYNNWDYPQLGKKIWEVFKSICSGKAGAPRAHYIKSQTVELLT